MSGTAPVEAPVTEPVATIAEPIITPDAVVAPVADPAPVDPAPKEPVAEPVPEPKAEPKVEEPKKPELHTDTPTDFSKIDGDKPEAKTEEKPGETPEPKPEAPKVEEPIATYDFAPPEGITIIPEKMEAFTGLLKEHAIPPETGKKLFDLYTAERQQDALDTLTRQHQAFGDTRRQWREQRAGDAEIGGAGMDTVTKLAAQARDRVVDDSNRQEFNDFLAATGAGDHPAFWRIMYRFGRAFQEPAPPPDNRAPPPNPSGRPRSGVAAIFDHSTSTGSRS